MTPDELTELECVIDDYCREAVGRGFGVYASYGCTDQEHCPLACVATVQGFCDWTSARLPGLTGDDSESSAGARASRRRA